MTKYRPLYDLPLFANDDAIALALMGPARADEWRGIATLLERRGLPKIDTLMGGRYVPAVKAFFDREYGVGASVAQVPDGPEDWETWKKRKPKSRRSAPSSVISAPDRE